MHVLLTGPPGVGKTTLAKKVAETLMKNDSAKIDGFFTEEVRDENQVRKGFDVVSIKDQEIRKPLALANAPPVAWSQSWNFIVKQVKFPNESPQSFFFIVSCDPFLNWGLSMIRLICTFWKKIKVEKVNNKS